MKFYNFQVIGTKTKICIVMEYVAGGQLSDRLGRQKMKESDARKLFQQLIDAVDYCHNRGVYHRDLKVREETTFFNLYKLSAFF